MYLQKVFFNLGIGCREHNAEECYFHMALTSRMRSALNGIPTRFVTEVRFASKTSKIESSMKQVPLFCWVL